MPLFNLMLKHRERERDFTCFSKRDHGACYETHQEKDNSASWTELGALGWVFGATFETTVQGIVACAGLRRCAKGAGKSQPPSRCSCVSSVPQSRPEQCRATQARAPGPLG